MGRRLDFSDNLRLLFGQWEQFSNLSGKTIRHIRIKPGEEYLEFETDCGFVAYQAEGDCCSTSWFADMTGISALLNATIQNVETIEFAEGVKSDGRERQEQGCDKIYGFKLTTSKGHADIIFRNSSNGYYGGWLTETEVIADEEVRSTLKEITQDWSAHAP